MQPSLVLILSPLAAAILGQVGPRTPGPSKTVVFVCEHGNVKSLIAREWFNRVAAERGLDLRAVSRGVTPEASVPPAIADALRAEGFDVSSFEARAFSAADAAGAVRVVGIGVDLSSVTKGAETTGQTWEGIPPASKDYAASREALRARIEALLRDLASEERRR